MTAYLVNHTKKKRIFAKREDELRHAIRHEYSEEKIAQAAEKLRAARFAVLKAKFSRFSVLPASSFSLDELAERDPAVAAWVNMTAIEIASKYGFGKERESEISD